MDHLWSPWRYRYVTKAEPKSGCVFCAKAQSTDDEANLIVYRGEQCFVLLNLYPYTNGHIMVVPYLHVSTLEDVPEEPYTEMMQLTRRGSAILRRVYRPKGLNLGMNLGECAGAGIAEHVHMHLLPRWPGDVNFMTAIAETRVHPEELSVTRERLAAAFAQE